jgi:arylsulfatase A-like enzyme
MRLPALALLAGALLPAPTQAAEQPRLIVQVTFDQLRGDLLERYSKAFTGGFRRVLDQGYWVRHGEAAHGLTLSFPGHATLATGLYPSHHGLTANEWWQRVGDQWQSVSVVRDARYRIVGRDGEAAPSPWQMKGTSIGDWIKAASPSAKAIAIGSDAAIPYAGRKPDGLYWFDSRAGGYTTSTYYRADRPAWVLTLNQAMGALPRTWDLTVPDKWRALTDHPSRCPPFNAYATRWTGGGRLLGPHRYEPAQGEAPDGSLAWLGSTPLIDEELLRRVGDIVRAERLGADATPDYLALAIGATDSVGHDFGPLSLEQLDTLLRLDRALGAMLDDLDREVGKGRYVVAISADHGVADPPEDRCLHRVTTAEIEALLDRVEAIARSHQGSPEALIGKIAAELGRAPFVGDVYTEARLASAAPDDWKAELMKRAFVAGHTTDFPLWSDKPRPFHPARYGIVVQFKEGMTFDRATSVHGSPYAYDRLVPVIFYGAGVPARQAESGARTADVAPTLAALAGVATPDRLDGHALIDVSRDSGASQ